MNQLTIFIDGWCPICIRFSKFIRKIDFSNQIIIQNIRITPNAKLNLSYATKAIASIDSRDRIAYGFETMYRLSKRLPILWILFPFLWIFKMTNLGNKVYDAIAVRRNIIPIHCDLCEIEDPISDIPTL